MKYTLLILSILYCTVWHKQAFDNNYIISLYYGVLQLLPIIHESYDHEWSSHEIIINSMQLELGTVTWQYRKLYIRHKKWVSIT